MSSTPPLAIGAGDLKREISEDRNDQLLGSKLGVLLMYRYTHGQKYFSVTIAFWTFGLAVFLSLVWARLAPHYNPRGSRAPKGYEHHGLFVVRNQLPV